MKTIIINSPTYGIHEVFVDDEDFETVNRFKWQLKKHRNTFYAHRTQCIIGSGGKKHHYKMHRIIMGATDPNILIDHKDRNGLNNQRSNLRIATLAQNQQNKKSYKNSTSRYLGVFRVKNNFAAQIKVNGKSTHLGTFSSEIEAAKIYDLNAKKHFGDFANLNFK